METGLYIHVPFCLQKCRYCDFISYPYREEEVEKYVEGIFSEMEFWAGNPNFKNKKISSLYIGGGTPTCLPPEILEKIIRKSFNSFNVVSEAEVSIESNPGTAGKDLFETLLESGVNRLSLGVQSCHDKELSLLGRPHSFNVACQSFRWARQAGFQNIGIDLIFGIPGQKTGEWVECLKKIIALEPEHISLYGLQVEEDTPLFQDLQNGHLEPCDDGEELKMYWEAIKLLEAHGFEHYEISNFASPGKKCWHNLLYWHNQEYLGLGPAAHSFLDKKRFANEETIDKYFRKVKEGEYPVCWEENITNELEVAETIFLGLRMIEGLDLEGFKKRFGHRLEEKYPETLSSLKGEGFLEIAGDKLRLTEKGLPVANQIFKEFLP